jgi:hypothetical protein
MPTVKDATLHDWPTGEEWSGGHNTNIGPFNVSGTNYVILGRQNGGTQIVVKADSSGDFNFTTLASQTVDAGNSYNHSLAAVEDSGVIYIAYWDDDSEVGQLGFAAFDTAQGASGFTAGSGIAWKQIDTAANWSNADEKIGVDITISNGATPNIVIFYAGEVYRNKGTNYNKVWCIKSSNGGTTFGTEVALSPDETALHEFVSIAPGSAEWVHCCWYRASSLRVRSYKPSDDSLSTAVLDDGGIRYPCGGVGFDVSGTWEIRFGAVSHVTGGSAFYVENLYEDGSDHAAFRTTKSHTVSSGLSHVGIGIMDVVYDSTTAKVYVLYCKASASGMGYKERDASSSPGAFSSEIASWDTSDTFTRVSAAVVSRDSSSYLDCAQWENAAVTTAEYWEIVELTAAGGSLPVFPHRVMVAANANLRR